MHTLKTSCRRFLKLLLAATLFVLLLGITASAADVKVKMVKGKNGFYSYRGVNVSPYDNRYHVIKVSSDGYLTVSGNRIYTYSTLPTSYGSMNIEFYNSKMKRLDNQIEYVNLKNSTVVFYGVKKGTYYIKTSGAQNYNLAVSYKKWTNKGGSSKSKAVTIKQKKLQKGLMPAGEKSKAQDWYKFKVTKKKVLYIDVDTANNGFFEFYLYGPSYKKGTQIGFLKNQAKSVYSINSRTRKKMKIATGTYYIKVVRSSNYKKSSGAYTLKWYLR